MRSRGCQGSFVAGLGRGNELFCQKVTIVIYSCIKYRRVGGQDEDCSGRDTGANDNLCWVYT